MMIQTSELKKLEEVYGQSGNQIVLLYGRDNCQKEQLIKEFCKEKKFFLCSLPLPIPVKSWSE